MVDVPASTATTINLPPGTTSGPSSYSGRLERYGDRDWIRVELVAGQTYNITSRGGTTLDGGFGRDGAVNPNFTLRNSAGVALTNLGERFNLDDNLLRVTAPTTGTYYIDVGSDRETLYGGDYFNGGDYVVSLSVQNELAPLAGIGSQLANGYWYAQGQLNRMFWGTTISVNLTGLTAEGQVLAQRALDVWANIGGLTFNYVTSGGQITFDDVGAGNSAETTHVLGPIWRGPALLSPPTSTLRKGGWPPMAPGSTAIRSRFFFMRSAMRSASATPGTTATIPRYSAVSRVGAITI